MHVFLIILVILLGINVAYLLLFALAAHLPAKKHAIAADLLRFAVIIPAYKENRIIKTVAKSAREHDYPPEMFDVFVVADGLEDSTIEAIEKAKCQVIVVDFTSSTKAKSLNAAINFIGDDRYDAAVVLDVDNIMQAEFLQKMNNAMQAGFQVVQGHRTAKNTNTATAILDAASEEINNSIFRKGHRALGLSAMLIGSAFAIDFNLFKRLMANINDVAGEDRELEIAILQNKIRIEYAEDAVVLDEKVESWQIFTRQRSRWAAAQMDFISKYFSRSIKELFFYLNFDYFYKVWHTLIPPRILLLAAVSLMFVLSVVFPAMPRAGFFQLIFAGNVVALLLALPKKFYSREFIFALLDLPKMLFSMIFAWTKIKGQKNIFLHTPHNFEEK